MPKTKISEFSATPGNNTDIDGINIAEGCAPSGINDAIRELMAQLKDFQAGTAGDSFNGPVGTSTAAAGAFTTLSSTGNTTLGDASGDAVTINGATTFVNVSPTITPGTANGVTYLNGSKVLTSGSALTFDGTSLGVGIASPTFADGKGIHINNATGSARLHLTSQTSGSAATDGSEFTVAGSDLYIINNEAAATIFYNAGSEQARLTSTGLGIGTSSPSEKLTVAGAGLFTGALLNYRTNSGAIDYFNGFTRIWGFGPDASTAGKIELHTTANDGSPDNTMLFDSSGNLGLGVTPSAWATLKPIEIGYIGNAFSGYINDVGIYATSNAYYNGGWKYAASSKLATRYSAEAGVHSWSYAASGTAGNAISFTQAMTLDGNGDFLIGTTSAPANGANARNVVFNNPNSVPTYVKISNAVSGATASDGFDLIMGTSSDAYVFNRENGPMIFGTNNTERARITSGGDLLVGKTATDGSVVGVQLLPSGASAFTRSGSTNATSTLDVYSTGAGAYRFYVGMDGTVNATNTTISAISDQRLKENVQDLDVGLDKIMALKPRKFDWKEGKGKDKKGDRGWIAQEFEQVFPDMITTWKDAPPEGEEPYKAVNADLIPVLVKAIQEQQAIIEQLKARLDAANL
jgi:hypothetical protein